MKLIVGLGNPGKEYAKTRHNAGFICLNKFLDKYHINPKLNKSFNALVGEERIGNEKTIFLMPQTYMNLSGEAVIKVFDYYKIQLEDVLIIYDDMDIEFGHLRLREAGSAGGHNGMKNIILHFANQNIKRVRIGISNHDNMDAKDYVLSQFSKEELETLNELSDKVSDIIELFIKGESFNKIMANYNG